MTPDRRLLLVRVLLTLTGLEFFGPILRDFSHSHATNPEWVGHARVHLVWLLGFMALSGVANLWLVWFRKPFELRNLWLSAIWQGCNLGGFWIAVALNPVYEGAITVPGIHVEIFGYDENVVAFTAFSLALGAACAMLRGVARDAHAAV